MMIAYVLKILGTMGLNFREY